MDLVTLAIEVIKANPLQVAGLIAFLLVASFFVSQRSRSKRLEDKSKAESELAKLRTDLEAKIRLVEIEADSKREADNASLERERSAVRVREMDIQAEQDKRQDATMNRLAQAIETSNKVQEASNRILTSMYETQEQSKERHEANAIRLENLRTAGDQHFLQMATKLDAFPLTVATVKDETVRTLGEKLKESEDRTKQDFNALASRVDNITHDMRNVSAKINELGIISAQLKKELVDTGRVDKIDEIGRLAVEVMQIVKGMNDQMQRIRKGTGDLSKAPVPPNTDSVAIPTIAQSVPLVSAALDLDNAPRTRTGNTDNLPKLPQTEKLEPPPTTFPAADPSVRLDRPVTFATPDATSDKTPTQQLVVTPPTEGR